MPAKIDLTNRNFGRLNVLGECSDVERAGRKGVYWNCLCSCGNQITSESGNLKSGNTTSCGCLRRDNASKVVPGMKFGRLTVLARDGVKKYGKTPMSMWHCACECGEFKSILGMSLMAGKTRSCGCLLSESTAARAAARFKDLTGMEFGSLVVIDRATRPGAATGNVKWLCACGCGNLTIAPGNSLTSGFLVSCGCKRQGKDKPSRPDAIRLRANVHGAKRRASELRALKIFDRELFDLVVPEAYALARMRSEITGVPWEVDHDVPLQSKLVTGFHNEFNLRVLTKAENIKKGNRFWKDMP
jgi:hypothetical protein